MFRSIKEPKQELDLDWVNRLFALAIDDQKYEDITRAEAKRLHQPQPVREAVSVETNAGRPRTAIMGA